MRTRLAEAIAPSVSNEIDIFGRRSRIDLGRLARRHEGLLGEVVRGDLGAVVRAILMDYEARSGAVAATARTDFEFLRTLALTLEAAGETREALATFLGDERLVIAPPQGAKVTLLLVRGADGRVEYLHQSLRALARQP